MRSEKTKTMSFATIDGPLHNKGHLMWTATDFSPGDFAIARGRRPSQTGRMTVQKLTALIEAGYGQGHFHRYRPWLAVTKRDYSPVSNMGHLPAPELGRMHHYRAMAERGTILLAKWLGAVDAREGYPVWPWSHSHPGVGLPNFPCSRLDGLVAIADEARIKHGFFPGTSLPFVATLDILTTWIVPSGEHRLVALENKPWEIVNSPQITSRAKERLELTRRYCQRAEIGSVIVHAEKFPASLVVNLDHLVPNLTMPQQEILRSSAVYGDLVECLSADGYVQPIAAIVKRLSIDLAEAEQFLWQLVRLAIWYQDVDHDITVPYNTWCPLVPGGRKFRSRVRAEWTGDII
jgi:hypothetical protein